MASKPGIRARTLDPAKPLSIIDISLEPDVLNPVHAISRMVLQLPTGMEKDEEEVCPVVSVSLPCLTLSTGATHPGCNQQAAHVSLHGLHSLHPHPGGLHRCAQLRGDLFSCAMIPNMT